MRARGSWSLEVVIAELQALHAGGEATTRSALMSAGNTTLVAAVERYCGTFVRAHKLAGIAYVPARRAWTPKRVLEELRRLHRDGVELNCQQLTTTGHAGLVTAAKKHHGSWRQAIAMSGVPGFTRSKWKSLEMVCERLRALHEGA